MTALRSSITGGNSPPNTASELVKMNFMPGARWRAASSNWRVASKLTCMPRSKSLSAWLLTMAARWNSTPQSASISRPPRRAATDRAPDTAGAYPAAGRAAGDVRQDQRVEGQRATAVQQRFRQPLAEKTGAAGDDDVHMVLLS